MGKKTTEFQKRDIIAYYATCKNYSQTARKYKKSLNTIKSIILNNVTLLKKCDKYIDRSNDRILEQLDSDRVKNIINLSLKNIEESLNNKKVSTKDNITIFKSFVDSAIKWEELKVKVSVNEVKLSLLKIEMNRNNDSSTIDLAQTLIASLGITDV